ncbi:MAG: hypothetical protein C0392_02005 [Syntrophus sp. (in: bacteria)]|nr:hypothetical protein [Syntrophus sp. (in: bacteria)]
MISLLKGMDAVYTKKLFALIMVIIFIGACMFTTGFHSVVFAKDTIDVVEDKDKTVYTIESDNSSQQDADKDKENAWKMLQNQNLWIGGRGRPPAPAPVIK